MTTRRLRPPGAWRGRTGLFGPFEFPFPSAIFAPSSVKTSQRSIDPDWSAQRAGEAAVRDGSLEALQAVACVRAASGLVPAREQLSVAGDEADQLRLRRLPPAPRAG